MSTLRVVVPLTDRASAGQDVVFIYLFKAHLRKESKKKKKKKKKKYNTMELDTLQLLSSGGGFCPSLSSVE
jgi:hypothetical protein